MTLRSSVPDAEALGWNEIDGKMGRIVGRGHWKWISKRKTAILCGFTQLQRVRHTYTHTFEQAMNRRCERDVSE